MMKRIVSGIMFTLLLMGILTLTFKIQPVKAIGIIYIRADGSIDPPDAPISTFDNVTYTLTGNITSDTDGIVIERDNITLEGAGYSVLGNWGFSGNSGLKISKRSNLTISNVRVENFSIGILLDTSMGIELMENKVSSNVIGIWIKYSAYCTLFHNLMNNNSFNFGVEGFPPFSPFFFMHSIDTSNLVNGKPVYYIANQSDVLITPEFYPQIGYLGLVNCRNVTIDRMNVTANMQGLLQSNHSQRLVVG